MMAYAVGRRPRCVIADRQCALVYTGYGLQRRVAERADRRAKAVVNGRRFCLKMAPSRRACLGWLASIIIAIVFFGLARSTGLSVVLVQCVRPRWDLAVSPPGDGGRGSRADLFSCVLAISARRGATHLLRRRARGV